MIRKLSVLVLAVFLTAALTSTAFASNGTQIGTVGARSTAMGSSFRGLADDWSAVFFNPAGLTQLDGKWSIGISCGLIMPRGSYTASPYPAQYLPFSGMNTTEVDAVARNFPVPAVGIFFKPSEKVVFGLGVYAPFGLGAEWDLVDLPADYGNATGISKDNEHYSDHQVITIQPTIAFNLSDKFSIGIGASYMHGKMDLDLVKLAGNPAAANWATLQAGLANFGITLQDLSANQYRLVVENNLKGTGSAYGFNAGLLFKPSEKFQIGISVRYFTDLKLSGTVKQTMIMHGDATILATLGPVPAIAFANASDPTGEATKQSLLALFSGQNYEDEYDIEADLPLPMTVGAGIAYKPSPRLTLTADASYTNWASWGEILVRAKEAGKDDVTMKQDWSSTIEIGGGFEFLARNCDTKQLFIRGGFYTTNTPAPDLTMSPTILDPNRRYTITGGLGFNFGKISINLAGEYVLFGDKDVTEYDFDDATLIAENYAGIYKFNAWVFILGTQISL